MSRNVLEMEDDDDDEEEEEKEEEEEENEQEEEEEEEDNFSPVIGATKCHLCVRKKLIVRNCCKIHEETTSGKTHFLE